MFLNPERVAEYKKRHDAIWPELVDLLKSTGISDYSIYLDEKNPVDGYLLLFAVLRHSAGHTVDVLSQHPVMRRWWAYMADIMRTHPDGSPVAEPLPCMFRLD
ncbi:MAG: L-rhamnose mutarotase [Comamonadaceae bacterium]|nr:MAG: L-rhamnose mutarotase [Comamonadaceae bacterium]